MAQSSRIPLHVYQVLEEEYISLHGPILPSPPPGEAADADHAAPLLVPLPDGGDWREVEAARDWFFRRGHVKRPLVFAASVLPRSAAEHAGIPAHVAQQLPAFDWSREKLKEYVYGRIDQGLLSRALAVNNEDGSARVPDELAREIEGELNKLLSDPNLYDSDRFIGSWVGPASRALIALREGSGGAMEGDDLLQFNRLLLEDGFPELEKIHNVRLAAVQHRFHVVQPNALSLSGGGIRSGTFALGLLQGLARCRLLGAFDYLSTVSGGGYIGSWLTAWLQRHPDGLEGVTRELANDPPEGKIDPEPRPLLYLRQYSNFITPKAGLLTADTWTFVGIYLRNLLLNWIIIVPLLVAVLLLPRLVLALTLAQPDALIDRPDGLVDQASNFFYNYGRYVFLIAGFACGVWALAYINFNRPALSELLRRRSRVWRERADQSSFLRYCLLPLVCSALFLTTYYAWSVEYHRVRKELLVFLVFGFAFAAAGGLVSSFVLRRWRGEDPYSGKVEELRLRKSLFELSALLAAGVVGGLLFWALTLLNTFGDPVVAYQPRPHTGQYFDYYHWVGWTHWSPELYACFAVPLFLLVFWGATTFFVGVSSFFKFVTDEDREWWARLGAWVLIAAMAWAAATVLVIFAPVALLDTPRLLATVGGVSGLVALAFGRSARKSGDRQDETKGSAVSLVAAKLLPLLALVFIAALGTALSLGTSGLIQLIAYASRTPTGNPPGYSPLLEWFTNAPSFSQYLGYVLQNVTPADHYPVSTAGKLIHMNVLHHTSIWLTAALLIVLLGVGMIFSRLVNLNLFSLHGGYRNRLIRAFLGASRPDGERQPNPFTGFDMADNINMHELRPALLDESDFAEPDTLAQRLMDDKEPLSKYLADRGRLKVVEATASVIGSPALVGALRNDLNAVLTEESLYASFPQLIPQGGRADAIRKRIQSGTGQALSKTTLRTDYHVLLNRLVLEQAYPNTLKPSRFPPPPYKLLHVINTALNLVGGDNLAWQQRKAEPFSITPLHCGCFRLGYRPSRDYGGKQVGGISIGTAAAISGAAASSNMGYYTTSPVLSLLLTFFNVRLGWWLGNPGPAGQETYHLRAPRTNVKPVISEALGMTDDTNEYVYLTDGGHFENLALYEMVLRRCHLIVVSDGAQDEQYRFADLGNAVRKIRIDLGVSIDFPYVPIYAKKPEDGTGMYWAIGRIRYGDVDKKYVEDENGRREAQGEKDGLLLYVKPAVYGDEPRDILQYKEDFPAFPHQSTGDQFFDEPQFESYRALGAYIMGELCGRQPVENIFDVVASASAQMYKACAGKSTELDPGSDFRNWLDGWLRRDG